MPRIKAETHGHSVYSDGRGSPSDIVNQAIKSGLGIIALTDHNTTRGLGELIEATKRAQNQGTNIIALPGVEVTTNKGHVGVYFPGREAGSPQLRWAEKAGEHNWRPSLVDVVKYTLDHNGVVVFNHPETPHIGSVRFDDIKRVAESLSDLQRRGAGIEVFSWMGQIIPGVSQREEQAHKVAADYGMREVAGTDYHRPPHVGSQQTIFEARNFTSEAILEAFYEGKVYPGEGRPMTLFDRAQIVSDLSIGFAQGLLASKS
ncbi:CehA/McbA family metallohydrolase [Candidatus Gottesmanbacteria bacterium]|nr:CehA/McbA family metallohydrolase [Candidatus Gottesmanbacteria bacterium]